MTHGKGQMLDVWRLNNSLCVLMVASLTMPPLPNCVYWITAVGPAWVSCNLPSSRPVHQVVSWVLPSAIDDFPASCGSNHLINVARFAVTAVGTFAIFKAC